MIQNRNKKNIEMESNTVIEQRSLDKIKEEIISHKKNIGKSHYEIGRLLIEAKKQVSHGEWLSWLKDNVDYSEETANRYIRVAKGYSAYPYHAEKLGVAKATMILAIPENERQYFIETYHEVNGEPKYVADMNREELNSIIKKRTAKGKEAEESLEEKFRNKKEEIINLIIQNKYGEHPEDKLWENTAEEVDAILDAEREKLMKKYEGKSEEQLDSLINKYQERISKKEEYAEKERENDEESATPKQKSITKEKVKYISMPFSTYENLFPQKTNEEIVNEIIEAINYCRSVVLRTRGGDRLQNMVDSVEWGD